MRSRTPLRAWQTAEEALQRVLGILPGGGGGLLPVFSHIVYVNKGGSDATGDGTIGKPFLTITKGLSVTGPATLANFFLVLAGPGTYVENVLMPPFVAVSGQDQVGATVIQGSVGLDPSFAVPNAESGLSSLEIFGHTTLDFLGIGATANTAFFFANVFGELGLTATSNGGSVISSILTTFPTPIALTDVQMGSQNSLFTNVSFSSSTAAATWGSANDDVSGTFALNGVAHPATFAGQGTAVIGALTSNGAFARYSATAEGIPSSIVLVGGAPSPVLTTRGNAIGYSPTNAVVNWAGTPPGAVSDPVTLQNSALDRLANVVAAIFGAPIP